MLRVRKEPVTPLLGDADGLLPPLNVPQVMLQGLTGPVVGLWLLTLPFGFALAMIGHPWLGVCSCLANMAADAVVQAWYRRWMRQAERDPDSLSLDTVGLAVAARAVVAIAWPVAAVLLRGGPADLMFLGLMGCMLLSIAVAQGSLSTRLFWMSATPVLAGLGIVVLVHFPPLLASGLMLALGMLSVMLSVLSGGIGRLLGDWTDLRERNNGLIARLQNERAEAEAAREEARRATLAKSSFLATMSHEIRTPMNGVLGMAQMLKSTAREDQREQIDTLIHSGEFLMSILNDILDISRIDAGRMDIVDEPVDLHGLAAELLGFWRPMAGQKGLTLTLDMADDVPRGVQVDGRRVRQILFNLIGNALKFTPTGSVTLALQAQDAGEGRVQLRFSVQDSGIGIEADALPALFDRFSQADDSQARAFGGTGLGLAISRQLAELMGGQLSAESTPGSGSTFHLDLTLDLVDLEAVAAEAVANDGDATGRSLDILAVDDNPVNLMVLEQLLTAFGHRVDRAGGGAEALDTLALRSYDLVMMDIQMPGMTGIEAVRRLRDTAGPNRRTPVLAVTADVLTHDRRALSALGFDGQVSKPIQISSLMTELAAVSTLEPEARAAS